jgi:hypothetical protein
MKKRLWRLLPLMALLLVAGAKKEPAVTLRFYTETNAKATDSFAVSVELQTAHRQTYVSKIPDISEHNIQATYLFQNGDGTLGCCCLLDENGRLALDALSVEKRGRALVAVMNGREVIDLLIDKRISDGIVTIPTGLTPEEAKLLQKTFKQVSVLPKKG